MRAQLATVRPNKQGKHVLVVFACLFLFLVLVGRLLALQHQHVQVQARARMQMHMHHGGHGASERSCCDATDPSIGTSFLSHWSKAHICRKGMLALFHHR